MILREKIFKLFSKHFNKRTELHYAIDDFEELILEERKAERERIKKIIRERIKKIIKEMPDTFPELESDTYDEAYKDAKSYMLTMLN